MNHYEETVDLIYTMFLTRPYFSGDIKTKFDLSDSQWERIRHKLTERAAKDGNVFGYHPLLEKHCLIVEGHKRSQEILEYTTRQLRGMGWSARMQVIGARRMGAITKTDETKLLNALDMISVKAREANDTVRKIQKRDSRGRFVKG